MIFNPLAFYAFYLIMAIFIWVGSGRLATNKEGQVIDLKTGEILFS